MKVSARSRNRSLLAVVLCASGVAAAPAPAQVNARLFRFPDVSKTEIAFVYGNDVWVVPRTGGVATRLTTPAGEELFPRFSPDGSRLAFSGNYDGNTDVYVMPASGGVPTRVTHHPGTDRMVDWYPSGDALLIASNMTSEKDRFSKLFRVSPDGGLPQVLPLPFGEYGDISADGRTLAYLQNWRDFRTWKRYRGGLTTAIWLFDLGSHAARKVPGDSANNTDPMWHGKTLYFLSDRAANERMNIWAYDTDSGDVRQVTHYEDYDIHFPAVGPDAMVYEEGGKLWIMDLATEQSSAVDVRIESDFASIRPRLESVGGEFQDADISPSGKRAVVAARGDLFTLPAEHGAVVTLEGASASAARHPAWSPDGRQVAYWSDRTGEYELTIESADGTGEPRTVTKLGPGFRYRIFWSPDSKKVAYIDQAMRIQLTDVAGGKTQQIGKGNYFYQGGLASFVASWSPDSRYVAYGGDLPSRAGAIFVFDTKTAASHQVTHGFYNASEPAFDPEGKYLYLLTNQSFQPSYSDVDGTWIYANSTQIAALPLTGETASPLAPRNDEEKPGSAQDDEETGGAKAAAGRSGGSKGEEEGAGAPPPAVAIDFDGLESRAVILPPGAGNYGDLQAVKGKVLYRRRARTGASQGPSETPVLYWDLGEREEKTILEDADAFRVSADGKKLLALKDGKLAIVDLKPGAKLDKPLKMSDMQATIEPRAEWRQIFTDAWRFERDYFYDPKMHGVDWPAMRQRYGALLDDAVTREDVNFVIGELIGELSSSHTYRGGGDIEHPKREDVGLLGVDWKKENGAFRIARIVRPAPWESEVRSPLDRSGVDLHEGDYVLAVDGRPLDPAKDPWASFAGLAGETVTLTVNGSPTMDGARRVIVAMMKLDDEQRLRNLAWIQAKRERVAQATDGRVGYIYVPDTSIPGQTELVRQFAGQFHMDGLIIDERFNSGGQIPDRFVELLNRPVTNFWATRDGVDWQWPPLAHTGPEVMLINEWSGSGGDAFPWLFRRANLGPLVGTRTWGGLIGISGVPPLVDGGAVTVPTFGIYSTEGSWVVENQGVTPDITVEMDPSKTADGSDPQLEAAIAESMKLLRTQPPVRAKKPAYPVKVPGGR